MTFGFDSTTDDVLDGIDLTGQTVLITGAGSGLGQETARAVAARGASVVMAVRDAGRAEPAAEAIRAAVTSGATVEVQEVDLGSFASIRSFTDRVNDSHNRLDAIIANAGVMACPEGRTADGFETQFGTNHLGHFLLVNRLRSLLAGGPARIVNLSSAGHRFSDVVLDDVNFERSAYEPWQAYGRSKTANVLFAVELDRRGRDGGVRAAAVHPGSIMTPLGRHITEETITTLNEARAGREQPEWKTPEQGAATTVWAGFRASADEIGGRYCEDCHVSTVTDDSTNPQGVFAYALDPETATALWTRSEELVGEAFPD